MARRSVSSRAVSALPPQALWNAVRTFGLSWHPAVSTMTTERGPGGRIIRAFTVRGDPATYRERLTYLSDSERTLAYTHLEGIEGVERYDARLVVAPADAGGSVVSMTANLSAPATRAAAIAAGTKAIFDQGTRALAGLPPREAGGARDIPLSDHSDRAPALRTILVDDMPRLAVSATPEGPETLVLFLHGIGGARGNWAAQLAAIAPHARAAALDLRGYGDSTLGPSQSTVDDYCADILRIREVLGGRRLILCGLSFGAWIATSFAMRHGDMLAGLVLSGGCTGMSEAGPDEREAFRISRETPLNEGQVPADFAPGVVTAISGPNASRATRDALRASMASIPAETYRDALRCFTNPLEQFDFSRVSIPVLLMTGEFDRLAPPHEIRHVAERIWSQAPDADVRFEVIADAGHVCNLEQPGRYNSPLVEFVRRVGQ